MIIYTGALSSSQCDSCNSTETVPQTKEPPSSSEIVAWILVSILTVLFIGLVTVNIIVLWIYKKRSVTSYEMEDNPCYVAIKVKQTTDSEEKLSAELREAGTSIYEQVRLDRTKIN